MKQYSYSNIYDVSNDKYPLSTHLVVETTNYVYFVDSTDQTKIYKVAVASGTCTQVDIDPSDSSGDNKSRDQDIQALWFDETYIWGVDCDNDGTADDFDVWKLAIATDSCTEIGTSAGAEVNSVYGMDIFKCGANMHVMDCEGRAGQDFLVVWDVDAAPFVENGTKLFTGGEFNVWGPGAVVNDDHYILIDIPPLDTMGLIIYDSSEETVTSVAVLEITSMPEVNQRAMAYDGDDTIYTIFNLDADSKDYLYSYSITGNTYTKLGLYDVAMMANRFTDSTDDAPFNLEKGFHVSSRYIYQIPAKNMGKLRKIDDLTTLGVDGSIVAITDTYMFLKRDDTSIELWQYEDIGDEIHNCDIDYEMGMVTLAEFTTTRDFGSNVTANIYDDSAGLLFSGTIYSKKYDGLVREYKCVSYDKEMNDLKLSYDATAGVALNVAIEAILDNCGYLYYDSSITANATEIKADWNNIPVKEMLDTIAALAEWVWYVDTDGKVYFNDGTTDTGHTITNATGEVFSQVVIKDIQAQINYVKLYGGYVSGVRKTATAEDEDSQQLHGLVKYIDHYPHITDQTQLNTLAAAILARADISSNPKYVYVSLYGLEKEICGERINFAFSPLSLSADDFTILKIKYDATGDVGTYTLSSGFISEEVVYGASSGVKTQPADEEQMDILGASVSGGGIENVVEDETPELGGDLDCNDKALTEIKSIVFQDGGSTVDIIRDEDNMATDDDAALATQQSIKAYADTKATAAEAHAYVEANALTMENDITFNAGQTFDGKDVSGLCTAAEAHAYVEANALTLTENLTIASGKTIGFADGGSVDIIRDEDDMATDDANALATQQSIKKFAEDTAAAVVEDDAYGAGWNGDTTHAPSQNAVFDKIATLGGGGLTLPVGIVLMYKGAGILGGDTANILTRTDEISEANGDDFDMEGWYVCNGQTGTPNLQDKFIRCENDDVANTGGEDSHELTEAELAEHQHAQGGIKSNDISNVTYHGWGSWTPGSGYIKEQSYGTGESDDILAYTNNIGSGDAHENRPAFYSMIFVMRIS